MQNVGCRTENVGRIAFCVWRSTFCVLRSAFCVLRSAFCVLRSLLLQGRLSPMYLLGIDVGTGGTRALIIDTDGRIVSSATDEHVPFASPQTGWAEQDPRDWWRAASAAVRAALGRAGLTGDDITAIGFSGQ